MRGHFRAIRTAFQSDVLQYQWWSYGARRCFTATALYRDSPTPITQDEAPPKAEPKATVRSRFLSFVIGGGAALSYAWYKRSNSTSSQASPQNDGFLKYTLIDKETTSPTSSIFTIQPVSRKDRLAGSANSASAILSIQLKQPQLQIARAYTCLPPIPGQPEDAIRLLIRQEEKGEVSGYLHALPLGSDVEVRGYHEDFVFPEDTKEVIFLAGGTGVSPALKTAEVLGDKADVHILWANRRREDCAGGTSDTPIAPSLLSSISSIFKQADTSVTDDAVHQNTVVLLLDLIKRQSTASPTHKIAVDYFVDEEGSFIRPSTVAKLLQSSASTDGSKLILVSGPAGFINYWAGPKQWINGQEQQGPVQGALAKMQLQGWSVVKL